MGRVRNKEVRRRARIEKVDKRISRWFGHIDRMDVYRLASRVLLAEAREYRDGLVTSIEWMCTVWLAGCCWQKQV